MVRAVFLNLSVLFRSIVDFYSFFSMGSSVSEGFKGVSLVRSVFGLRRHLRLFLRASRSFSATSAMVKRMRGGVAGLQTTPECLIGFLQAVF